MSGLRSSSWCVIRALLPARASRWTRPLRLAALAAGVLIGGVGTVASPAVAVVPASTPMVDLGQASTYAVISGASVGNTVSAAGAPHTIASRRPRREGRHRADRLSPRRRDRHQAGRHRRRRCRPRRPRHRLRRGRRAVRWLAARGRAGRHDDLARAAHGHRRRLEHDDGDPRRRGRPERRLRLSDQRRAGHGRRKPCRADQRRPGLAGSSGRSTAPAPSARTPTSRGRSWRSTPSPWATARWSTAARSLATAPSRSTTTSSTAPRPPSPIAGGASAITTDTTPTISGTTDVEAPGVVTVTVAGQTLTATPSGGAWSVTSALLANGVYPVVASVDRRSRQHRQRHPAAHRRHRAAASSASTAARPSMTNDPTPTIAGTSDVAAGTIVHVTVGAQAAPRSSSPTGRGTSRRPR